MSDYIHYRSITSNHLSRSIIISQSNYRPNWMNSEPFQRNTWPTPAMRTYESIVSREFAQYYWKEGHTNREIMVNSVSRELHHECGRRIYKRLSSNVEILHRQSVDDFKQIILKRLLNLRYPTEEISHPHYYDTLFGSFTEGERILVSSRSRVVYEGIFQFISVVDSNYCYIKFDSRNHIICWEKSLVEHMNLREDNNRRLTRQMARSLRVNENNVSEEEVIVLSDTGTLSEDSSDEDDDSNSMNQGGMGVARARNDTLFDSSSSSDSENHDQPMANNNQSDRPTNIAFDDRQLRAGTAFQTLFDTFGDGTENKTVLDDKWLTKQGFATNPLTDEVCAICYDTIPENILIYDIKCDGKLIHPLHTECAQRYIAKRHTSCAVCRFPWLE